MFLGSEMRRNIENNNIVGIIGLLVIFAVLILCGIVLNIRNKKIIKKTGENLATYSKGSWLFLIIFLFVFIIFLIITIDWPRSAQDVFLYPFCIVCIIVYYCYFFQIKGVYEDGLITFSLISYELITWDKIRSYKWINMKSISFLLNRGDIISFNRIYNYEKLVEIIEKNNIKENNN